MPASSGWTLILRHLETRFSKGANMDLSGLGKPTSLLDHPNTTSTSLLT